METEIVFNCRQEKYFGVYEVKMNDAGMIFHRAFRKIENLFKQH